MKLFKVFLSLFLLVLLFLGVSLFFPRTYRIERSVEIGRPVHETFLFMSDLRNWPSWSAWNNDLDSTMYLFYGRRSDSAGGSQYFYGERLGSGRFKFIDYRVDTSLTYNLYMHGGNVSANGTFLFLPISGGTRLTWLDSGDVGYNPIYRYMIPSKEKSTGQAFDEGLARIKQRLESKR